MTEPQGLGPSWIGASVLPPLGACRALMRTFEVRGVHQPVPTGQSGRGLCKRNLLGGPLT